MTEATPVLSDASKEALEGLLLGIADDEVVIGFWEYARVGVPLTLVTLVLGWLLLVLLPV